MVEFHIPTLAPDVLFHAGKWAVTNTMVNTWIALLIFLILGIALRRRMSLRPAMLQNACEYVIELILPYFDQVTGERKKTMRFLPIVGSLFFFILLSNWLGLLPGTGSIRVGHEFLFRPANTDLNLTVAMALSSVVISHLLGIASVGFFVHVGKFIQVGGFWQSVRKGPIAIFVALVHFFVGLLEIISELAKVLSLSLRLFGNMFAGEVLISVIGALAAAVVPAPFMLLELLVGVIQASVFSMLTLVYLTVASAEPDSAEH